MAYTVHHTVADKIHWMQYDGAYLCDQNAIRRARNLALDHGGYVCVKDRNGKVIYGTDPVQLDRAIDLSINFATKA